MSPTDRRLRRRNVRCERTYPGLFVLLRSNRRTTTPAVTFATTFDTAADCCRKCSAQDTPRLVVAIIAITKNKWSPIQYVVIGDIDKKNDCA